MLRHFEACLSVVTLLVMCSGCERTTAGPASPAAISSPALIMKTGKHVVAKGNVELEISLGPDAVVQYKLIESATKAELLAGEAGSNVSRWFLFCSDDGELWVYSGDVGTFVWHKPKGGYQKSAVSGNADLVKKMPKEFFEALPSSTQKTLGAMD
jgi:hypothetical protein